MTVATANGGQPGSLERGVGAGSLADVVETVLDKGLVIDAQVSVAVVGIQLVEINARVVIASVETYLRFAETVDRLSITPEGQKGLPDLVGGASGAAAKGKAASGLGTAAKQISGAVADSLQDGAPRAHSDHGTGTTKRRRAEMADDRNDDAGTGLFVYGIVPSDVAAAPGADGIGCPPTELSTVQRGDLAVLVSEVDLAEPIGRPADLTAYQLLLDGTASVAPVLPVRFGTVLSDADAVGDLLEAHHDQFAAALDELEDRVQYTVRGRFDETEFVGAFLARDRTAAALAEQVRGRPEIEYRDERIRLGEMISQAVELRREAENRDLIDAAGRYAEASVARPPSHELDAVHVAFLVSTDGEDGFVRAVEDFAGQRRELVRMRLLGPLAPYDFLTAHQLVG